MRSSAVVSAVVYADARARSVGDFVQALDEHLDERFGRHEILVVADGRTDLGEPLTDLSGGLRGVVHLVELSRHHGLEIAMIAGLERTTGDFVIECDSAQPAFALGLIDEMHARCALGEDSVAAYLPRNGLRSRAFYAVLNRFSYLPEPLAPCEVRVSSRRAVSAVLGLPERVRYRKALYALSGYRTSSITYSAPQGYRDRSALTMENLALALDVLLSFSSVGLRAAHATAILFGGIAVSAVTYTAVVWFTADRVVEGWTTVMALLSVGFAGVFAILGLLAEYVTRILVEVRRRPTYAVREHRTWLAAESKDRASGVD